MYRDEWLNVLIFSQTILPDLSNYCEDDTWPIMLDEFMEWYKMQQGLPVATGTPNSFAMF